MRRYYFHNEISVTATTYKVVMPYQAIGHELIRFMVASILYNRDIMLNHITVSSPDKKVIFFPARSIMASSNCIFEYEAI